MRLIAFFQCLWQSSNLSVSGLCSQIPRKNLLFTASSSIIKHDSTSMNVQGCISLSLQAVVYVKLRAEYSESKAASGLEVVVPMPPEVSRLACDHATEVGALSMPFPLSLCSMAAAVAACHEQGVVCMILCHFQGRGHHWLLRLQVKPSGSQSWDWQEKARRLVWKFKRVQGNTEHMLKVICPLADIVCHVLALSVRHA